MSLPPALLKRLAKRGLIEKGASVASTPRQQAPAEEIIAEDYDDVEEQAPYDDYKYDFQPKVKRGRENFWSERIKRRITDSNSVSGYESCPNKFNVYHRCSLFCVEKYGDGIKEPSESYLVRKARLLKRHPLPKDWKEIFDRGLGVHYYLNTIDNMVSWLPPSHPKAVVTKSAAQMRRELEESQPNDVDVDDAEEPITDRMDDELSNTQVREMQDSLSRERDIPKPPKKAKARDLDKVLRNKSERRHKKAINEGHLDPMDPAAYSDIPRGKWSAGLEAESRKSGVDSTVTGTAFQQRPYPSPGAILLANAAASGAKKRDSASPNDSDDEQPVPDKNN